MRKTLFALGILFPLASWAQSLDVKPGLWENSVTTEISGMPAMPSIPQETLDKMPAAVREKMMKSMAGSPRTVTDKSCVTPEQLKGGFYNNAQQKGCTTKLVSSTSSTQKVHMDCTMGGDTGSEKMTMQGDMTFERIDSEHIKGNMVMKATGSAEQGGRSMDTKLAITGKWLSSDCGSVKPYEAKK